MITSIMALDSLYHQSRVAGSSHRAENELGYYLRPYTQVGTCRVGLHKWLGLSLLRQVPRQCLKIQAEMLIVKVGDMNEDGVSKQTALSWFIILP